MASSGRPSRKSAVRIEPVLQGPRHGLPAPLSSRMDSPAGSRHHIQPRTARAGRRAEQPFESCLQMKQHRLDVLARPQSVDAEVHTITREEPLTHVANLHAIGQSAAGLDAEVREDRMSRVGVFEMWKSSVRARARRRLIRLRPSCANYAGTARQWCFLLSFHPPINSYSRFLVKGDSSVRITFDFLASNP